MTYDFEYFWYADLLSVSFIWPGVQIYTLLMMLFVPDILVYLEYDPLSYMYFVNTFFCGLRLSCVKKVFHSLNL